jgi:hypothetical protein
MSPYWGGPNAGGGVCGNYLAGVPEIQNIMIETARHIAAIEDREIERLVNRIPNWYLPDAKRVIIIQNLLVRKGNLQGLLGI